MIFEVPKSKKSRQTFQDYVSKTHTTFYPTSEAKTSEPESVFELEQKLKANREMIIDKAVLYKEPITNFFKK